MAGGSGTRLYPRSRENSPKHLKNLLGETTLLQQTYGRVSQIVPKENIFISTNEKYIDQIKEQLPDFSEDQIIAEPAKRNTAPAMAYSASLIYEKDNEALIATVHSDHQVLKEAGYISAFKAAFEVIEKNPDYILSVGVEPTFAHTGYGYVEKDEVFDQSTEFPVFKAKRFVEKPDKETATKYVESGNFFWNAGYFVMEAKHFLDEYQKFSPEAAEMVAEIVAAPNKLKEVYPNVPEEAVDTAVMEKTDKLLVLAADMGWCDVGSWEVVTDLIENKDLNGNYSEGLHIDIDSKKTVVLSNDDKRLIATIGLDDIIVIATEDAILVTKNGESQKVKKVVEEIKKRKLDHLL